MLKSKCYRFSFERLSMSLFENSKSINKISTFCLYNVNTFAQYTADAIHF
jgi:hypothetical protein